MGPILGPENGPQNQPVVYVGIRNGAYFPGTKSGPRFHTPHKYKIHFFFYQAIAGWRWWNRLETEAAAAGKKVLRVNMDETNIRRANDVKKGLVLTKRHQRLPVLIKTEASNRGSFSHMTFICDDPSVQPLLPQVILGNEHVLRKQDLDAVAPTLPSNVYLIRGKSSWVDHPVLCATLKWLARALSHLRTSHEIILLLDCCSVHLHTAVLRAAYNANIRLCFVPRKTTWLLQPCDTHVFRRYKAFLRREYQRVQLVNECPDVSTQALVGILVRVVRLVLQGHVWSQAFSDNGFCLGQGLVCNRIKQIITDVVVQTEQGHPMTVAEMMSVLPRGRVVNSHLLWARKPDGAPSQPGPSMARTEASQNEACEATPPFDSTDEHMCGTPTAEMQYEDSGSSWVGRLRPGFRSSTAASSTDPLPGHSLLRPTADCDPPCRSSMSPETPLQLGPSRPKQKAKAVPLARPPLSQKGIR